MNQENYTLCCLSQENPFSKSCFVTQNTLASDSSSNSELAIQAQIDLEPLSQGGEFGLFATRASQQIQRSHSTCQINKKDSAQFKEALTPSLRTPCSNMLQFQEIMLSLGIQPTSQELQQFQKLRTIEPEVERQKQIENYILELAAGRFGSLDELQDEQVEVAFSLFGKDTNGLISREQFKSVMAELGTEISEIDLSTFWEKADSDGDGLISMADFKAILKQL